jgi:erythromycin esterase-like protein
MAASSEAVLAYLQTVDPAAAARARRRYASFDHAEEVRRPRLDVSGLCRRRARGSD